MKALRILLALALALLPYAEALAAAGYTQITVKDAGGTTRNMTVLSSDGALTGNLNWANTVCDQAAGTTCASVGTAGSPSTNALTVQPVTLGSGTAANAARVELANNGTGVLATVGAVTTVSTVTTLSTLTGGGVASGSADSGNPVKVGGKYNLSAITLTDGNRGDFQQDVNGYLKINLAACGAATCNPNGQATMANSSPVVIASNQSAVAVTLTSTTLTGTSSVNTAQVNGVTVLTGTGATGTGAQRVTVSTDQATNAGAALVKGGVGIVNGGSRYQHIAASQTAAVLQSSTGATGDYLSHCVIYPGTTGAGSVTVYDNTNSAANNVIEFVTGTLSNLAPIAIPVGAISRNGAWKIDTGANETVVCYGSFS